jgi:hypothetical protein
MPSVESLGPLDLIGIMSAVFLVFLSFLFLMELLVLIGFFSVEFVRNKLLKI